MYLDIFKIEIFREHLSFTFVTKLELDPICFPKPTLTHPPLPVLLFSSSLLIFKG